jgi:hypothetical protein
METKQIKKPLTDAEKKAIEKKIVSKELAVKDKKNINK